MRFNYQLSDQTRQALGNAKLSEVAREMDVDQSHLSHMLSNETKDPFPPFIRLYNAMLRAGYDVSAWDAALAESKARYRPAQDMQTALADKIRCGAHTDALAVESLTNERGCNEVFKAITHERDAIDTFEASLLMDKDDRAIARAAIEHRNGRRAA